MAHPRRFTDLTLIITERCNLRCGYCYVPKRQRDLPLGLAVQACDWFLGQAPPHREPSISFFGGEPLLDEATLLAVMAHARARRPRVRFAAPTNGTLLGGGRLARLRAAGLDLALSIDAAGAETSGKDLSTVQPLLSELRDASPIVRMTVTPANVGKLHETVVSLTAAGLTRIMHQPALEERWPGEAIDLWRAEHQRLLRWLVDRYTAREPMPDLMTLEGISRRLAGAPSHPCGAGVTTAALDIEGRLFGCYRSVYDPRPERVQLGDLRRGWLNEPLLAAYSRLHPDQVIPEEGSCASCEARQGCTVYCPAMGHVLLGDLRGVPADACRLMRVQVELVREGMEEMQRFDQHRRRSIGAHVAAAALALGLTASSAACDSRPAPGVCTQPVDGGPMPGVCAHYDDAALDTIPRDLRPRDLRREMLPGGLCAYRPDMIGPGGLCPPPLPDHMIGGLCPVYLPDGRTPDGKPTPGLCAPGLCPMPGVC